MKRKMMLFVIGLVLTGLLLAGLLSKTYNRDKDFEFVISGLNNLTNELVETIDTNPTLEKLQAARKILAARKIELREKYNDLKEVHESQVSSEVKRKFFDSRHENDMKMKEVMYKNSDFYIADKQLWDEMKKLFDEYKSILE